MWCVLCDSDLIARSEELITPFNPGCVQPSSYDLALGPELLVPRPGCRVDLRSDEPGDSMDRLEFAEYVLRPGSCVLGSTTETVRCPEDLSARIEGKSSLGRLFMAVHITAGVIDAGFVGQVTLEIVNHGPWDIVLWAGMKIAQVSYIPLSRRCAVPYGSERLGSHYLGQSGPTPSAGRRGR